MSNPSFASTTTSCRRKQPKTPASPSANPQQAVPSRRLLSGLASSARWPARASTCRRSRARSSARGIGEMPQRLRAERGRGRMSATERACPDRCVLCFRLSRSAILTIYPPAELRDVDRGPLASARLVRHIQFVEHLIHVRPPRQEPVKGKLGRFSPIHGSRRDSWHGSGRQSGPRRLLPEPPHRAHVWRGRGRGGGWRRGGRCWRTAVQHERRIARWRRRCGGRGEVNLDGVHATSIIADRREIASDSRRRTERTKEADEDAFPSRSMRSGSLATRVSCTSA